MSQVIDSLFRIRMAWIRAAGEALTRGESMRLSLSEELSRIYDLITESIVTGNPSWMEPYLQNWVDVQVSSEVAASEDDHPPSMVPVLHALRTATIHTAQNNLQAEEAIQLINALEPIFAHAVEFLSMQELLKGMRNISNRLVEVQEALERLDRSKSNFIAVAAHELKTPLTLVEGYSKMLAELFASDDPSGTLMIEGISTGTRRLKEIIDDMIDVSMIDNNMLSIHYQPVWFNRLLELAQREVEESVQERNQRLEIRQFEGSDEMTYADPERILQAIVNVIRNAVKYTPDGGDIIIDGRRLPGFSEITIHDTGIGIDPEDQTRIFEKFGRVGNPALHSSGKTKFMGGGPGLGLPIAKGILEAHGGAIWVESPGADEETCPGSTFHLMIPIRETPPDDKSAMLFGGFSGEPGSATG